jgi:hypothetical protein
MKYQNRLEQAVHFFLLICIDKPQTIPEMMEIKKWIIRIKKCSPESKYTYFCIVAGPYDLFLSYLCRHPIPNQNPLNNLLSGRQ